MKLSAQALYRAWPDSDLLPIILPKRGEALSDWWGRAVVANGGSTDFGDGLFSYVVTTLVNEGCTTVAEAKQTIRERLLDLESVSHTLGIKRSLPRPTPVMSPRPAGGVMGCGGTG